MPRPLYLDLLRMANQFAPSGLVIMRRRLVTAIAHVVQVTWISNHHLCFPCQLELYCERVPSNGDNVILSAKTWLFH